MRHKARFNVEVSEQKTSNSFAVACLSFFLLAHPLWEDGETK
jgi:hypothetical protein